MSDLERLTAQIEKDAQRIAQLTAAASASAQSGDRQTVSNDLRQLRAAVSVFTIDIAAVYREATR